MKMFKNFWFIFLVAITISFVLGCSEDSDDSNDSSGGIKTELDSTAITIITPYYDRIWAWNKNGMKGNEFTSWPGQAMQKNSDGYYTYTFNDAKSIWIVLNDGKSEQTGDIEITSSGRWFFSNAKGLVKLKDGEKEPSGEEYEGEKEPNKPWDNDYDYGEFRISSEMDLCNYIELGTVFDIKLCYYKYNSEEYIPIPKSCIKDIQITDQYFYNDNETADNVINIIQKESEYAEWTITTCRTGNAKVLIQGNYDGKAIEYSRYIYVNKSFGFDVDNISIYSGVVRSFSIINYTDSEIINWTSSDENVASVLEYDNSDYNYKLKIKGINPGTATITITSESGAVATCVVTCIPIPKVLNKENAFEVLGDNYKWDNKIEIPYGVTSIDDAFEYCTSLESITIPETVTSIESRAFAGCTSLKSITIPEGVTSIESLAFYECTSLESITIPETVTSIKGSAFADCTSLKSITIPEGVTFIENYAFYNCKSLESITISEGVTSIGYGIFANCSSLESINIPETVTSIESSAFYECTSLESITIPETVTSIESSAFADCTSLKSINIPEGVTSIKNSVFSNCTSLTSVNIPEGVTSIENYAFSECTNLESITIPEKVTSIGSYAFYECTNLESITIPEKVTSIGSYAFYNCTNIKTVVVQSYKSWKNITFENSFSNPTYYGAELCFINGVSTPTISITLPTHIDVPLTYTTDENFVNVTAEPEHSSYIWFINMQKQTETSNTLQIDASTMRDGIYSVMVIIDGEYSSTLTVEVINQ